MTTLCRKVNSTAMAIFFIVFTPAAASQNQPDQKIWYQYCVASPDSTCFNPVQGAIDSVGNDVSELGGDFIFCLQVDTVDSGYGPVRVVLVLDGSSSMCANPGSNFCCTEGDGSGNCMLNDPDDMRIRAAHTFVDSLAAKSPESQIGVVTYVMNAITNNPISLSAENCATIHTWIDRASCASTMSPAVTTIGLNKTAATKLTYLGAGLSAGLVAADYNYNNMPAGMTRHIIQLTDGAWDDVNAATATPEAIIDNYKAAYPGRELPKVHGVFLSNAELHTAHGYPAAGCSGTDPVVLDKLERATALTNGLYFPGSTPGTVIENFNTLLDTITQTAPEQLLSLKVTNSRNGISSSTTGNSIRQIDSTTGWEATVESLPLEFGANPLTIEHVVRRFGISDTTITASVTIIRSTNFRQTLDKDFYKIYCELHGANIKITATPATVLIDEKVKVNATLTNSVNFTLSEVNVRLLTNFPDSENNAIATFHLDGNLTNASDTNDNGTGNTDFYTAAPLFGTASISGGSFYYMLAALNGDFLLEEWIQPTAGAGVLIDGGGIEFGIDTNSTLYFKTAAGEIVAGAAPVDAGVWSHVAVARQDGQVVLFINGIAVSEPVAIATPITAGKLTLRAPDRWIVDEIRINAISRMVMEGTTRTLTIPTLDNASWTLLDVPSNDRTLTAAASAWKNGTSLDFTFTSPVEKTVVVNIRQNRNGNPEGTGWSKNSNPVMINSVPIGPFVTKGTLTPVNNGNMDTLLIEFSEEVSCASLMKNVSVGASFEFYNRDKITFNVVQGARYLDTNCTSEAIKNITLIVPKGSLEPGRDSILLTGDAVDLTGTKPQLDKKGPVVWGTGRGIVIIPWKTGPNLKISDDVKNNFGIKDNNGKVVTVKTVVPLLPADTVNDTIVYSLATIYDAVGNVVATDRKLIESAIPRTYFVLWNGLNRNGRRVGNGAYFMHSEFNYIDGMHGTNGTKMLITW